MVKDQNIIFLKIIYFFFQTIDGYYDLFVRSIYNTVVAALSGNPHRRFIAVEVAFMRKWWQETATELQKAQMKALIANGK